ncbi:MAG: hypothetical protein K9M99_06290 [Candidatus Cloacimonetes bacterium]|nr:hypothetical protein [Candidatus Cloacimonadota bacterium]
MRKIVLLALFLSLNMIVHADEISLNFFIHPQFEVEDIAGLAAQLQEATMDSVMSINIYAGEIFKPAMADSVILYYLGRLPGMLFSPNDFLHYHQEKYPSFGLLAANIESDSVTTLKKFVITVDTLKVGIFSIYTPDWFVKQQYAEGVSLRADVFTVARKQVEKLKAAGCDQIVMLTSLSKYVVDSMASEIDVDSIINFDYAKTKNTMMGKDKQTGYYFVNSEKGNFGRLKITFTAGRISTEWQEHSWKDAHRN